MVTILEEIDPEYYKDFIFTDKRGRKYMYTEAKKAIYGTLEASLLFWAKLSKSLKEMGYQRNDKKQDCKHIYLLLTNYNSVRQLAVRPIY